MSEPPGIVQLREQIEELRVRIDGLERALWKEIAAMHRKALAEDWNAQ